jgi:Cupin domain
LKLTDQFVYFLDDDKFHDTDRVGFRRRVVTGDNLQLCFWRITGGAEGSFIHSHATNEQLGIVARGRLNFRIGEDKDVDGRIELGAGEMYLARPGIWHGDSIFIGDDEYGECWILDVFAPPRDDLRAEG